MSELIFRPIPNTCNSSPLSSCHGYRWNQCVSSLTGFSSSDVLGRKLVDEFVSSGFKDSVSDILKHALMGIETAK